MITSNIERFDHVAGRVFGHLYEHFPVPCYITAKLVFDEVTTFDEHLGMEIPNESAEFFAACVSWLHRAGYIEYREWNHALASFSQVILTAKGLEVLKALPASLQASQSIGEHLMEASKTGSTEVFKSAVAEALSLGVRILGFPTA